MNISIPKIPEKAVILPKVKEFLKGVLLVAVSRTSFFGMWPFGPAFAAAFPVESAFTAFLGLCLGTSNLGMLSIKYILTFFIYYILNFFKKLPTVKTKAFALTFLTAVFLWLERDILAIGTKDYLFIMAEALLTGVIFILFSHQGEKTPAANLAKLVIFGAVLNGISGTVIPYINVSLPAFCVIFAAMCITYACELPLAALSSGLIAFLVAVGSENAIQYLGVFAICGGLGSLLSGYGKLGVVTGFLCGLCVGALYTGTTGDAGIFDILAPVLAFAFLPESLHYRISGLIGRQFEEEGEVSEPVAHGKIVRQLKKVAGAVCGLADGVVATYDEKENEDRIFERVTARVCTDCALFDTCKKQEFYSKNMKEIWKVIDNEGFCDTSNMPRSFEKDCRRPERFLSEFLHAYELYKQDTLSLGAAKSTRDIMARQYSEISNVIELMSQEIEETESEYDKEKRRFTPKITVRSEPKPGQSVSGDSVIYFEKDNKFYVILCDGMGSGTGAGHQSRLTARLFEKFLKAGFEKETSLRMINSALMLKADQESFSTVDILEIDTETGECEFLKVGSAQSFIKKKKEIEVISSKSLPVGILEKIDAVPEKNTLSSGDIILMMSDGISEAGSGILKNDWIKKLLLLEKRKPWEIADLIIVGAKARTRFSDDMTCCVIKIEKRKEE